MHLFALSGICVSFGANSLLYRVVIIMLLTHTSENIARLAAADVTVDGIAPVTNVVAVPTPAASISIVGVTSLSVQSNGATVYAETEVETQFAFISGTSTQTLLSTPTTIIGMSDTALVVINNVLTSPNLDPVTFAEDASFYSLSEAATTTFMGNVIAVGDELVCSGTRGAEVTCVQEDVQSAGGQVQTGTVTISAVRTPAFTIKSSAVRAPRPAAVISLTAAVGVVCTMAFKSMY